jgi:CheY-like chemotaxis protein
MSAAEGKAHVLVVEDEPMLLQALVAGLSRLGTVDVSGAASVAEALGVLDQRAPDVLISDIDLPDRLGIELLGELGVRGQKPYVVFASAYVKAFRAQIPRSARVEVLEKPVKLETLREIVRAQTGRAAPPAPFGITDYLQIAALGRHSVVLEVWRDQRLGTIEVVQGEAWSSSDGGGEGPAAFTRLLHEPGTQVRCYAAQEGPGERNLWGSVEGLLLEAARLADEAAQRGESVLRAPVPLPPPAVQLVPPSVPPSTPASIPPSMPPTSPPALAALDPDFADAWERGVQAALRRDHAAALEAFLLAQKLAPDDKKVLANVQRLQALLGKGE